MASPMLSHPIWQLMYLVLSNGRLENLKNDTISAYPALDRSVPVRCGTAYITQSLPNPFLLKQE